MKLFLFIVFAIASLVFQAQDTSRITFRFPSDKSTLADWQIQSLDSLLSSLEGSPDAHFYFIEGHTDNIGNRAYNLELSERRCRSIKQLLLKNGAIEKRIRLEKFAFDLPASSNETETGRADNRRTTLTIISNVADPDWTITPQRYNINAGNNTVLTTKNGCKVTVPEVAFVLPPDRTPGKIELEVIEYNNPAYFIASGIPMSYNASGRLFMYHSEEMLSIKAFDSEGTPLALKDEAKITLNCRKVDSLYVTGFYKFNLTENKWFEFQKQEATIEPRKEKKAVVSTTVNPTPPESKKENIKTPQPEKNDPSRIADEKEKIPDPEKRERVTEADPPKEPEIVPELRLDSGNIIKPRIDSGNLRKPPPPPKLDSSAYACAPNCCEARFYIKLGLILSQRPLDLEGLDLSGKYSYTRHADRNHLTRTLQTEEQIGSKAYYHIKLPTKRLFLRRKAIIKFRYNKEMNPELKALRKVKWTYRFKDNPEHFSSFRNRSFHDMRIIYDAASKTATVKLEEKGQITTIRLRPKDPDNIISDKMINYQKVLTPRIMSIYSCFWAFDKRYFAGKENNLPFMKWVDYFNSNLDKIHARYDSLDRNIEKVIADLNCPCFTRDSIIPDSLPKMLLKRSGPDRILLIGLGLYNYDQVIPLEDVVNIQDPVFTDKKGRRIIPKQTFLVLQGINGMVHFRPKEPVMLVEKYGNTIFVVSRSNRRYKIDIDASENMHRRGNAFVLEDITVQTKTLEGLEKALRTKKTTSTK